MVDNYSTGDNPTTTPDGTTWIEMHFFEEQGTGDRRAIKLPDGTIQEIS